MIILTIKLVKRWCVNSVHSLERQQSFRVLLKTKKPGSRLIQAKCKTKNINENEHLPHCPNCRYSPCHNTNRIRKYN